MRQRFEALRNRVKATLDDHRHELLNSQDTPPPFPGGHRPALQTAGDYFTCHRGDARARGCNRVRFYIENGRLLRVQHCYEQHERTTEYASISPDGTVLTDSDGKKTNLDEVLRDFLTAELI